MNKEELEMIIGAEPRNSFIVYEMERLNHNESVNMLNQLEKQIIRETFEKVEKEFDMQHACRCPEWCDCWEDFKASCEGERE